MSVYLEIPWEEAQYLKVKHRGYLRPRGGSIYIYSGDLLPIDLKPYRTTDFSYARWLEDDARGKESPVQKAPTQFTPNPHQKEAARKILISYQRNTPGFLLGDLMGLGKTLSALLSIAVIAQKEGYTAKNKATLLVVCPKGAIPVWVQTIQSYHVATNFLRILVINYQQLNKLLKQPEKAKKAKSSRTKNRETAAKGEPLIDFTYIIFDEAHMLKNYPSSAVSLSAVNIAKLNTPYIKKRSPFVVYSTATPGSTPLNFAVMANWLAPLISNLDTAKKVTPYTWGKFLEEQKFSVKKGKKGYNWVTLPWYDKNAVTIEDKRRQATAEREAKLKQKRDTQRIGKALTRPGAPFLRRSPTDIAGWPEQQYIPLPVELTPQQLTTYQEAWSTFRKWLKLTPAHSDPKGQLVQQLRYRQKASLLKVPAMHENIVELVEAGNQVYVSVEFIETLDEYMKLFTAKKIPCVEISGRNVKQREENRQIFQRGEAKIVLCTVTDAISLHAEETLPDGKKATSTPRITILHDVRQDPLKSIQACGRAHRNGQNSLTYIPMMRGTVEEKVVESFINKYVNMKTMTGSTQNEINMLERVFTEAAKN